MRNLYKTDLKRIFKDKLFLITCILAGVFAFINPLLYKVLFVALGIEDIPLLLVNAKSLFFTAFAAGDNLGLIMPILIAIIVCKDFSQGTVRNKIISGKSRGAIFLSHFLTASTVICSLMLIHGLLTLGISLCFFDYQDGPFTAADFGYLMASLGFEMLIYMAVAATVTFIATISKNMGICIVLYLAASLGLTIVGSLTQVVGMFLDPESTEYAIMEFVNAINFFSTTLIGTGTTYSAKDVFYILISPILTIAGCVGFGILKFSKKNLK